jgi:YD repeat-containing protein
VDPAAQVEPIHQFVYASAGDYRVDYAYDGLDRLVARRETKDPLGAATATTTGFVYDGSRRLLELDLDGLAD